MPQVSIVVPVYNTEKYLPRCLDSLMSQTLKQVEIICVNDASTDKSANVVQSYMKKDPRIKLIDLPEHKGVSVARNEALKMATGDYIGFVDSDDAVDMDFYEKLYVKAVETKADVVKGDLKELCTDNTVKTYPQNEQILKAKNKLCFYISFTSAIYKRSLILQNKCFFDPRLIHTEDLVWLNKMVISANTVEIVPDVFYHYYRRDDSADTQVLSLENVQSAYIAWKHIFLNTRAFSRATQQDCSFSFQKYFQVIFPFLFRTDDLNQTRLFCRLLLFFYRDNPTFYAAYLRENMPSVLPFFTREALDQFAFFMQQKHSFMDLKVADFRFHARQNQSPFKLSVIIPVYNCQDYLKSCLDSLCRQTYKNLQIICVDDCSTDGSLKILKEYAQQNPHITVIQRTENGGQAAARQSGIDLATGEYIGFVDSDDWVDDDYFEKMAQIAYQDQTDIIINSTILDHAGDQVKPHAFHGHTTVQRGIYEHPIRLVEKFFCVVWNKLFRTSLLKQRQYTIPKRSAHEDLFFHYTTFAFAKNITFFDGPAYHYLYRGQSISNAKHDWGVEHIKVFDQIFDFYKENNLLNKKMKFYATMPFFIIKDAEMFDAYKTYFTKVKDIFHQNPDVFNQLDRFFADSVCECPCYTDYASKYSGNPLMSFLRRKK